MAKNGRYLVGQKFSNEQMERILFAYAAWMSPSRFVKEAKDYFGKPISPRAVYDIFSLTRKRLLALNVFPDPDRYFAYWNDTENRGSFNFSGKPNLIDFIFRQFKGVSEANRYEIMAECIYRAEHPNDADDRLFHLIKEAAKITGPFNRPPENMKVWWARENIRNLQACIDRFRESDPIRNKKFIVSFQEEIIEREAELARMLRAGARIKAARPKRSRERPVLGTNPETVSESDDAPSPTSDRIAKPEQP